jgi:hypothetical protein
MLTGIAQMIIQYLLSPVVFLLTFILRSVYKELHADRETGC